jgi:hypothetical protein
LFWDNTNKRLGIGLNNPAFALDINSPMRVVESLIIKQTPGSNNSVNITHASGVMILNALNNSFAVRVGTALAFIPSSRRSMPLGLSTAEWGTVWTTGIRAVFGDLEMVNQHVGSHLNFGTENILRARITNTGNLILQNGGTFTDAGFRLDVNGTARVQGVLTTTDDAVVNGVSVGKGGGAIATNTRVGVGAAAANTTGSGNSFFGQNSGNRNTTGNDNSFFGNNSGNRNTTGFNNCFFGDSAGFNSTTSSNNSFFGLSSGASITSGSQNSLFGSSSATTLTTGVENTLLGQGIGSNLITGGSNTGVGRAALRGNGNANVAVGKFAGAFIGGTTTSLITGSFNSIFIGLDSNPLADNQTNQIVIGHTAIGLGSNTTVIGNSSTTFGRWFGNLLVGSSTNSGQVLQVTGTSLLNGLSTIQGTTASDSGQLGAELLTTGTGDASWTGTSFATGYTHVAGSTTTLTSTLAGVVNTFYQITYTVSGRTAGSFTIGFGGVTSGSIASTGALGPRATTTGTLVITPTSDFNGTIVLSIRVITASSASVTFNSSDGTNTNQIRISSLATNTFIGVNSGRTNTTGPNNTFLGNNSGTSNTTGASNCFFGQGTGQSNTSGSDNSFFGRSSGQANTTGVSNAFFGNNSGFANTTGNSNSFFGTSAGFSNTTGISNSFFGRDSGVLNTSGTSNSFFGLESGLSNTTGSSNSFFGLQAGRGNTTGGANTAIGQGAGLNNTTGIGNTFIGREAARYIADGTTANTITNESIFIGTNSRANADNQTNQIVIGHTAIGLGSNTTVLGNTSTTFGRWYGSLLLGTTTNAASSILTMESTTQGFLPPRMTSAQRTAIASPAEGLLVIQTDGIQGLYIYINATWRAVAMV